MFFIKITNLSTFVGTHTITCTATGENGKTASASKSIVVKMAEIVASELMTTVDSDQIRDDGGRQFYVGENPNNYVSFNRGLWRIIGSFNGNLKIVSNVSLGNDISICNFYGDPKQLSSCNGYHVSELRTYLDSVYYPSIDASSLSLIETGNFGDGIYKCFDGSFGYSTIVRYYGTGVCNSSYNIAISSAYDVLRTSSRLSECLDDKVYNTTDCTTSQHSWMASKGLMLLIDTLNSSDFGTKQYAISNYGNIGNAEYPYQAAVYPVVFLKRGIKVISGTGTSTDPYILSS